MLILNLKQIEYGIYYIAISEKFYYILASRIYRNGNYAKFLTTKAILYYRKATAKLSHNTRKDKKVKEKFVFVLNKQTTNYSNLINSPKVMHCVILYYSRQQQSAAVAF